jgi:hypothetical protein
MPGVCCILGVCCPPNQQATGVAEKYGISQDAALALVTDHQLVPRRLEALVGAPRSLAGQEMLTRLLRHVPAELKAILGALGHPTEAEAAG